MSALLNLTGWDVLVTFLLGSLSGVSLCQAVAALTGYRRRTTTRLQRSRWREQGVFNTLRNGRTAE
jgi:hypothetical protein